MSFSNINMRNLLESIRNVYINNPKNNEEGLRNVCVLDYEDDLCPNCYVYGAPCENCVNDDHVIGFKTVSYSQLFLCLDGDGNRKYPNQPDTYKDFYYSNVYVKEYKWNKEAGECLLMIN